MSVWIHESGHFVDVVIEPHLAETFTICAEDPAHLADLAAIAPQPVFKTIHGCKFEWALHLPMNRVIPEGWDFLGHSHQYTTERLERPISPHTAEWYWEACKTRDEEHYDLDVPEGLYGYELVRDPADIITELQEAFLAYISLVPVYVNGNHPVHRDLESENVSNDFDEWEDDEDYYDD